MRQDLGEYLCRWGSMHGSRICRSGRVDFVFCVGRALLTSHRRHGDGGHASDYMAKNLRGKLTSRPEWTSAYRARDRRQ
jgi:hypothetical protein